MKTSTFLSILSAIFVILAYFMLCTYNVTNTYADEIVIAFYAIIAGGFVLYSEYYRRLND